MQAEKREFISLTSVFFMNLNLFSYYRAACNADAVLWWDFCPSVCLSVCPSVTCVDCNKTV